MITWFTSFTENFVIRSYQVTKIFRSKYDYTGASSARSPRYLRPRTDIAIWVIGSVCLHCAHPNPVRLLLAIHWKFMTWTWKRVDIQAKGLSGSAGTLSSTTFSLNSCSHSGNSCDKSLRSPTPLIPIFRLLCFRATGLPETSLALSLLSGTGFLFLSPSNTESYDEDEGRNMWRCNWGRTRWRTTNHTWYITSICCNQFAFHLEREVVFDRLSSGVYTHDPHRVSPRKELREFLQEAHLWRTSPIAWHTQSLLLWFEPRRWPSSDFLMSSWSPTQQSQVSLADPMQNRSRVKNKLSFRWVFSLTQPGAPIPPRGNWNVTLPFSLTLNSFLSRFQALLRAHRCCHSLSLSSWNLSSNFIA